MISLSAPMTLHKSWLSFAHLAPTGLGPWGDGMAQLVLQPPDLLLVIALVLLAAQSGRASLDRLPLLLPAAWLSGGLIGLGLRNELTLALPATAAVMSLGVLVALGMRLGARRLALLATVLTLAFAVVAGSALAGHAGATAALLGEAVSVAVVATLLSLALAPPHPRWLAIAMRVAGSWISAASLLMLGWLVRHPA